MHQPSPHQQMAAAADYCRPSGCSFHGLICVCLLPNRHTIGPPLSHCYIVSYWQKNHSFISEMLLPAKLLATTEETRSYTIQESCAIAKMSARCADKVNKQPHLHLRSCDSRLTQFSRTLRTQVLNEHFLPKISPRSPGNRWMTFGPQTVKMLG